MWAGNWQRDDQTVTNTITISTTGTDTATTLCVGTGGEWEWGLWDGPEYIDAYGNVWRYIQPVRPVYATINNSGLKLYACADNEWEPASREEMEKLYAGD